MSFEIVGTQETLNALEHQLDTQDRVMYMRFGDGEIFMATGGGNCEHRFSEGQKKEMIEAINLSDTRIIKGVSGGYPLEDGMKDGLFGKMANMPELVETFRKVLTTNETTFYSPVMFHYLIVFQPERFERFVNQYIRGKRIMYIGSRSLQNMNLLFGNIKYHIQIPNKNAYDSIEKIWENVESKLNGIDVCILAAGSASNIIQKRIWSAGYKVHALDFGSICDVLETDNTKTWLRMVGSKIRDRYIPAQTQSPESKAKINIHIPYKPGNLGKAYNELMDKASYDEWVLFVDHDVMLLRQNWYDICVAAIEKYGKEAGWITCLTNDIYCADQLRTDAPQSNDIMIHAQFGDQLYQKNGSLAFDVDQGPVNPNEPLKHVFSGFFILTHKEAWEKVGKFEEEDRVVDHVYKGYPLRFRCNKFLGVDNDYFLKLVNAGYKPKILQGVYAYHLRSKKSVLDKTSLEETDRKINTGKTINISSGKNKKNKKKHKKNRHSAPVSAPVPVQASSEHVLLPQMTKGNVATISACMIIRSANMDNPDLNLHRCLKSVKGVVDEIVVVNTRTAEDPPDNFTDIAESYGAKVYYHPWENDFSKARNQSIKYCTKDWLLLIDTDEELVNYKGKKEDLKYFLATVPDDIRAIRITLRNMEDGRLGAEFNPPKFFRRGTILYDKRVHNVPLFAGPPMYIDLVQQIHYGYDTNDSIKQHKFERTASLLHARLEDDPEDYECYFYLSQIYGHHGFGGKQIEYAEEYLKHEHELKTIKFDNSIYFSTTRAYMRIERIEDAERWLRLGLEKMPNDIDLLLAMTEIGVAKRDRQMILQGANKYIVNYHQWEKTKGQSMHFVHSYVPEALAFCIFHLANISLHDGMVALSNICNMMPQFKPGFKAEVSKNIELLLSSLDLNWTKYSTPEIRAA